MIANQRLIVALDVPNDPSNPNRPMEVEDAFRTADQLGDLVTFYKIGWPLYLSSNGEKIASDFIARGKRIFLDLKFGDIPHTVQRLVTNAAGQGIDFLSLNTGTEAVRKAVEGRNSIQDTRLKLLRITLLTSMNQTDLNDLGFSLSVVDYVVRISKSAREVGCDGIVCSANEAKSVRTELGENFLIVTPGIRPSGISADDHQRSATPETAIKSGADFLVVGRPIMRSQNPKAMAEQILEEMQKAFDNRGY